MNEPVHLGPHNDRVRAARELLHAAGRRAAGRFLFEGPTLLREAMASASSVVEIYATQSAYERTPEIASLARTGTAVAFVDERTIRKLSDVETPTGVVAVAEIPRPSLDVVLHERLVLVLADINDPGNAGTLLRSAEAFGSTGVVFGALAVDPYHPKVVRAAMGSLFRLKVAVADPSALRQAAHSAGSEVIGLAANGTPLRELVFAKRCALVVGHERRGLGPWEAVCDRTAAIEMAGLTESLNAAVAGSIALYEAAGRTLSGG